MRHRWFLLALLLTGSAVARDTATAPDVARPTAWPITHQHIVRTNPPLSIHLAQVPLQDARIQFRVARGGPDPDGDGPWTTTLLPASEIARRERFHLTLNGDFFVVPPTGTNLLDYSRNKAARVRGWAMTDGVLWSTAEHRRPFVAVTVSNTVLFGEAGPENGLPAGLREVIGGGQFILRDGQVMAHQSSFATARHPRSAIGVDAAGTTLTLLVVDGRQPKLSVGMSLAELTAEMQRHGCATAVNLDGGGSTTLVWESPGEPFRVLNSPSGQRERNIANVLGITVRPISALESTGHAAGRAP